MLITIVPIMGLHTRFVNAHHQPSVGEDQEPQSRLRIRTPDDGSGSPLACFALRGSHTDCATASARPILRFTMAFFFRATARSTSVLNHLKKTARTNPFFVEVGKLLRPRWKVLRWFPEKVKVDGSPVQQRLNLDQRISWVLHVKPTPTFLKHRVRDFTQLF